MNKANFVTVGRMVSSGLAITLSVLCLAPSAMINWKVQRAINNGPEWAITAVVSVGVLAVLVILCHKAWGSRQQMRFWVLAICALIPLTWNMMNAVANSGASKSAFTVPRVTVLQTEKTLKSRLQTVTANRDDYYGRAGRQTPDEVRLAIADKKLEGSHIWKRTKGCALEGHGTFRDDSKSFCRDIKALRKQLAAAQTAKSMNGQIAVLNSKLEDLGPVDPRTEHPKVQAFSNIYAMFGKVDAKVRHWIGFADDLFSGVLVEFLGAVGPLALYLLLWPKAAKPEQAPKKPAKPKTVTPKENDSIKRFLDEGVRVSTGGHIYSADLKPLYEKWCHENAMRPESPTLLWRAAGKKFSKRKVTNRMAYLGVVPVKRLELVV